MSQHPESLAIQRHIACDHGNTVVDAGPGSGKTTQEVIAVNAMDPDTLPDVWVTSHNNHINEANVKRMPSQVYVKGMHGTGLGSLYREFPNAKNRQYVVKQKYEYILRDILPEYTRDFKAQRQWSQSLMRLWDLARANMIDLTDERAAVKLASGHMIECPFNPQQASQILQEMSARGQKEAGYRVDFTDMLWLPVVLGLRPPRKFKHAFADEAQDFTILHCQFFLQMAEGARKHVLGDTRQAIYGFLGASGDAINYLHGILAAEPIGAGRFPLLTCWRCPVTHVELAREIEPRLRPAPNAIVGSVERTSLKTMLKVAPPKKGDVVLSRTNRPAIDFCYTLMSMGIDTRMPGKDIGQGMCDLLDRVVKNDHDFNFGFSKKLDQWISKKVARLSEEEGQEMIIASYIDRAESLKRIHQAADEENVTTIPAFKAFAMSLYIDDKVDDKDIVLVSTVHKYKGKETDHVMILNPDQIRHPKARTALEVKQEENIDYIARTRSREKLTYIPDTIEVECVM